MLKSLPAIAFSILVAALAFDVRPLPAPADGWQLAQGGGNAHGCPKGQQFSKAKKSCVPKA